MRVTPVRADEAPSSGDRDAERDFGRGVQFAVEEELALRALPVAVAEDHRSGPQPLAGTSYLLAYLVLNGLPDDPPGVGGTVVDARVVGWRVQVVHEDAD